MEELFKAYERSPQSVCFCANKGSLGEKRERIFVRAEQNFCGRNKAFKDCLGFLFICMNWHAEVQTVFLLIWGITMLLWALYPHIQNVALVHSCLEIPILKFLRCRSSSQMKRHMFWKFPRATQDCSQLLSTQSTEDSDTCDHFWKDWLKAPSVQLRQPTPSVQVVSAGMCE